MRPLLTTLLVLYSTGANALDNGLGRVPAMGYNSWYDLGGDLNEENLRDTVDKMAVLGLDKLGYNYFNLDDDWALNRTAEGVLVADPARFKGGTLKSLADYVHNKGLRFGTYTDRGTLTCGRRPGALGHEEIDAKTYASWGVDYLKEDSCNASGDHDTAFKEYRAMRDALNATGRPILFSLCGWNPWYAPVGTSIGNSWRIGPDDTNWNGVLTNIDINAGLGSFAGPGGFNDPCLLLAEDEVGKQRVSELQSRFQFSMWAVMTSPLLISANLRNMSKANLDTYSNQAVIAVNQDPMAKQGARIQGGEMQHQGANATNIWAKALANSDAAVAFANASPSPVDIACDSSCWAKVFPSSSSKLTSLCGVDLWTQQKVSIDPKTGFVAKNVPAQGGITLLRVSQKASCVD